MDKNSERAGTAASGAAIPVRHANWSPGLLMPHTGNSYIRRECPVCSGVKAIKRGAHAGDDCIQDARGGA